MLKNVNCPDRLISAIYASLSGANPWIVALEELRLALQCNSATLRMSRKRDPRGEILYASGPITKPEAVKLWEATLVRETLPHVPKNGETLIIDWSTLPPTRAVESVRSWDVRTSASHCYDVVEDTSFVLTVSRSEANHHFSDEDLALLSCAGAHFSRALRLRQKMTRDSVVLGFQSEAMDRLSVSGILIGPSGVVLCLNEAAESLLAGKDGMYLSSGRLRASDAQGDRQLQAIIRSALALSSTDKSFALSLKRETGRRDLGVVVCPRTSLSLITGSPETSALLLVRDSDPATEVDIDLMQQLFSFTRAEARLAVGLAKGRRFEDIEAESNIRHNTVRAHLRSMFAKADVNRQVELMHVLANGAASLGTTRRKEVVVF